MIKEIEELSEMERANKYDEIPQVYHPWRRYFARILDINLYNLLWSAFLAFVFHINVADRSNAGNILDSFITIVIMLVLEPLLLNLFGNTPGKAIFGLRIENHDGSRLSYGEGFERTLGVLGGGMGFSIPIYNLIRLWKSYKLCIENEIQPWDESISYTIKDTKWYRSVLYIGAIALSFAAMLTLISAQLLPPNKGDLTIEEFVENYNYYANYYNIDFGDSYLDETGKWEKKNSSGTIIYIGYTEKPDYNFTIENGYVTGVSFAVEIKNNEYLLSSYDDYMFLASLAFAGAQDEMRLFSKIPKRIAEQINNNIFNDYSFVEAGIMFNCNIEHSGYRETAHMLFPIEDAKENYFRLNFSMKKGNYQDE